MLSGERPSSANGNLLLDQLFNAIFVWTSPAERDEKLKQTFQEAWEAGKRPYLIPYGGSNSTGAAAYVFAMQELLEQNYQPDWIVFASSSAGTQAGLVAGARLFGFTGKILGISVDKPELDLKAHVATLASSTTDFLGEKIDFNPQEIMVL